MSLTTSSPKRSRVGATKTRVKSCAPDYGPWSAKNSSTKPDLQRFERLSMKATPAVSPKATSSAVFVRASNFPCPTNRGQVSIFAPRGSRPPVHRRLLAELSAGNLASDQPRWWRRQVFEKYEPEEHLCSWRGSLAKHQVSAVGCLREHPEPRRWFALRKR